MMQLPEYVLGCIRRLEDAGYPCYAVGGCVRDAALGLIPHDYDLCTAARPEQIKAVFADKSLVLAGEKHGTVGVITPEGVVEITTFRTDGDYADNRHPEQVSFVGDIREDLARRDYTVNAMAWSPTRGLADPFGGGMQDLKSRTLRAVGDAPTRFREDSLRILRGVRFALRFSLTPEPETEQAMHALAPLMDNLARERVFSELSGILLAADLPGLCRFAPILAQPIPELAPMLGYDQRNPHHTQDLFTHTAQVTAGVAPEPALRWAALLHDVGKPGTCTVDEKGVAHFYGHAALSAQMAEQILLRLKAPKALTQRVCLLIGQHMTLTEPEPKFIRRRLSRLGEEALRQLLALQEADHAATVSPDPVRCRMARELLEAQLQEETCLKLKDLAVNGHDLMALGYTGAQIGKTLEALLEAVLDEQVTNEKQSLLDYVRRKLI